MERGPLDLNPELRTPPLPATHVRAGTGHRVLARATPLTKSALTGTASDNGGGQVAGVEVSRDGGAIWYPATGQVSWTYSWTVTGRGSVSLKARAVDASADVGAAASRAVTVTCPVLALR